MSVTPFASAGTYPVFSDLFKQYWNTDYSFETIIFDNSTGTSDVNVGIGTPINADGTPTAAASIASLYGISGEDRIVGAGKREMLKIGVRGPGLLNRQALPKTDTAGAAIDQAALVTALQNKLWQILDESVSEPGWPNGPTL